MSNFEEHAHDGFEYFLKSVRNAKNYCLNRDSIKEFFKDSDPLIDTPPVVGLNIIQATVNNIVQQEDKYIISRCLEANVDPDALIKTAQKNAELQARLKTIREETRIETIREIIVYLAELLPGGETNDQR